MGDRTHPLSQIPDYATAPTIDCAARMQPKTTASKR